MGERCSRGRGEESPTAPPPHPRLRSLAWPQRSTQATVEELLALLAEFRSERAASEAQEAAGMELGGTAAMAAHDGGDGGGDGPVQQRGHFQPRGDDDMAPYDPLLVVFNAVLNSLVELGCGGGGGGGVLLPRIDFVPASNAPSRVPASPSSAATAAAAASAAGTTRRLATCMPAWGRSGA